MSSSFVAFDVGTRVVKAAVSGKSPRVASDTVPAGVIVDDLVVDRAVVVGVMAGLMHRLGVKDGSPGGVLLPAASASIHRLTLEANAEELDEALAFEVPHLVPDAPEELCTDRHLGRDGSHLVVCARREAVMDRAHLLEDAGLAPSLVDLDVLALANAVDASDAVLVLLGHDGTAICAVEDGVPLLCLSRPDATGKRMDEILDEHGLGVRRMRALTDGGAPASPAESDALRSAVSRLAEDLATGVERCRELAALREGPVVLAGGPAASPGLREFLEERAVGPVVLAEPGPWESADPSALAGAAAAPVVGLARRGEAGR